MQKNNIRFYTIIALLLVIIFLLIFNKNDKEKDLAVKQNQTEAVETRSQKQINEKEELSADIDALTAESVVIPYIQANGHLPEYYITKKEAREKGWIAAEGNLCNVLPGRAIGGDVFSNREKKLPAEKGRKWFEADLNYNCGRRNADRVVFSNDGLIYVTEDHYKTFERK